jgi:hypothetical protein
MCGLVGFEDGGETLALVLIEAGSAVGVMARGNWGVAVCCSTFGDWDDHMS